MTLEEKASRFSNDREKLTQMLKESKQLLLAHLKRRFSKNLIDSENKRMVSDDGILALQWKLRPFPDQPITYANQQTSVGCVICVIAEPVSEKFVEYVLDFYGPNSELYPMGATAKQVIEATEVLIGRGDDVAYDSLDREKVRDLMISMFGLVFPKSK